MHVRTYVRMFICLFYFLDKYCKITNVSIFVLGIYTCGTSVLLWWLYKGIAEICGTRKKHSLEGTYVRAYILCVYCTYVHMYELHTYAHVYVCMYVCMYVLYVRMYMCVRTCTAILIRT